MGKRMTRHTLALGIGRLVGVIGVSILACVAPVAANTCEERPPDLHPAVEPRQETATAARSRPRWTRSNDGELVAEKSTVYDATELNRNRRTQMRDAPGTAQARITEDKETDMPTDAANNIGKTKTAEHRESNMSSEPNAKKKHITIRSHTHDRSLARTPRTVLDHVPQAVHCCRTELGDVLPWNHIDVFGLLYGGQSVVGTGGWNDLLHIEAYGVAENTVEHATLINLSGWWPDTIWLDDKSLLLFNNADCVLHEFSCTDLTHQSTHSLIHLLLPGEMPVGFFGVNGTRLVCLATTMVGPGRMVERRTRIIDVDGEQVVCELDGERSWNVVHGTQPARIFRPDGRILGVDGRLVAALDLPRGRVIYHLAVGPGGPRGEGFQGIVDGEDGTELMLFDARGKVQAKVVLPNGEFVEEMVALPSCRRTLVQMETIETEVVHCLSYVYGDHGYRLEGKCTVPHGTFLLQDDYLTSAVFCIKSKQGALQFEDVDPIYGIRGLFSEK